MFFIVDLKYTLFKLELQIHSKLLERHCLKCLNGVNRLATKGKKYYRLPTKREKNYRQLTGKLLTDYRHYLYFFSERRVYCIFSTFLGSNQRYHATQVFLQVYHKTRILKSVCRAYAKNFYNPPSPTHYMPQRKFFPVQWKALPPNPPYRDGHKDSSVLCQHFHVIY